MCRETENKHFKWFANLLENHFEGINNKIKTLRRQGYGYPDDDYFFLKLIDASRTKYVRNPKSHKKMIELEN